MSTAYERDRSSLSSTSGSVGIWFACWLVASCTSLQPPSSSDAGTGGTSAVGGDLGDGEADDGPAAGSSGDGSSATQGTTDAETRDAPYDSPALAVDSGIGCKVGEHACNGTCVSKSDPLTCGDSCNACLVPAGGKATCDGTNCDFICLTGTKCGNQCTTGCCTNTDCPAQGGQSGQCDSSTHKCSYSCATGTRPCGSACISQGACCSDDDCGGNVACVNHACSTSTCRQGYLRCDNACAPPSSATPEVCDGKDNDCNGMVDDGLVQSCSNRCTAGTRRCVNGTWDTSGCPPANVQCCSNADCGLCQECVNGSCQSQAAGQDKKNECDGSSPIACRTGSCDGSGACQKRTGTLCDGTDLITCTNGVGSRQTCPSGQCTNNQCVGCGGVNQPCCNGTCNAGNMCQGGTCVTCSGGSCGTNNTCVKSQFSCASGAPVCVSTNINEGQSCGTCMSCKSGVCKADDTQTCGADHKCSGGSCVPTCGQNLNDACCAGDVCTGAGLTCYVCSGGARCCQHCGNFQEGCCTGGKCNQPDLACEDDGSHVPDCESCGDYGEPCCANDRCNTGMTCQNHNGLPTRACLPFPCGGSGQPCCEAVGVPPCQGSSFCPGSGTCS